MIMTLPGVRHYDQSPDYYNLFPGRKAVSSAGCADLASEKVVQPSRPGDQGLLGKATTQAAISGDYQRYLPRCCQPNGLLDDLAVAVPLGAEYQHSLRSIGALAGPLHDGVDLLYPYRPLPGRKGDLGTVQRLQRVEQARGCGYPVVPPAVWARSHHIGNVYEQHHILWLRGRVHDPPSVAMITQAPSLLLKAVQRQPSSGARWRTTLSITCAL
jgi:hypothetical protein